MDPAPLRTDASDEGFSSYRGATVEANGRRVAQVVLSLLLVTLAALSIGFFIAGAHHNAQINRLRSEGVRVQATVTTCVGQLGGSGSNVAGYTCAAAFTLPGGQHDVETMPGTAYYPRGSHLTVVVVPDDPALLAPLTQYRTDHASGGVYVLPSVCLGAFLVVLALAVRWQRQGKTRTAA